MSLSLGRAFSKRVWGKMGLDPAPGNNILCVACFLGIVCHFLSQESALLYTDWMHERLRDHLRPEHKRKTPSQKSSIFGAWIRKTFGSKAFLMAIWQTGLNIMPSGAPEHARKFPSASDRALQCLMELLSWLALFADAYAKHRRADATKKAREQSGTTHGESGLTAEQQQKRARRDLAWVRLREAKNIEAEVDAYCNNDHSRFSHPRSWNYLNEREKEALRALENGALQRELAAAKAAHGGTVQAMPFRLPLLPKIGGSS